MSDFNTIGVCAAPTAPVDTLVGDLGSALAPGADAVKIRPADGPAGALGLYEVSINGATRLMTEAEIRGMNLRGGTRMLHESEVEGATQPDDAKIKIEQPREGLIVATNELNRDDGRFVHRARLVTRIEGGAGDMRVSQQLFRWDGNAKAWVDVTRPAQAGGHALAVDWNMPPAPLRVPAGLPTMAQGVDQTAERLKGVAAESLVGEVPPSLVIPYVKDSILVNHFEFTPPGQNSYQHFVDISGRRWSATGERKVAYWANKGAAVVGAVNELSAGAAGVARQVANSGISATAKAGSEAAKDVAKVTETAIARTSRGINWNPFRSRSLDDLLPQTGKVPTIPRYPNGSVGTSVDFLELTPPTGGGRIYASTAEINHFHVDDLVHDLAPGGALSKPGKTIHVLSGRHGDEAGFDILKAESKFYREDFSVAPHARNVVIHDATKMTPAQMKAVMSSGDDVVLAWCHSENSRQVMKALGLDFGFAPF
jgi:hypothetical protein